MDINTEYERLRTLTSTPEGWESLETAWNTAMGQEKRNGHWYNISASKGDLVVGFAIDPETKRHILDTTSSDHSWAKDQMVEWLMEEHHLPLEDAEWRPVRGWAGMILDFQFPCIFMADQRFITAGDDSSEFLLDIERSILEKGIGLPLNSLFRATQAKKRNATPISQTYRQIAADLRSLKDRYTLLLYVGRFCPMHMGHQAMIGGLATAFPENHLVLIGSCNEQMSLRNLFNFTDRRSFILEVFPECRVAAMPDFKNDDESWFHALDDLIRLAGHDPARVAFIGGCEEDVEWYYAMRRPVHIVNRFGGTTVNVSGTEIRDHLISDNRKKLGKLVDARLVGPISERFALRWAEFRKR